VIAALLVLFLACHGGPQATVVARDADPPPGGGGGGDPGSDDCSDGDASVYPGAVEVCDGVDNDCDDEVDEGVTSTYWYDGDGDGYGDPLLTEQLCEALSGWVPNGDDCDDTDAAINPAAVEACDEVDDDCDGVVDLSACDSG
jgi:hypothetical protein